MSGFVTAAVVAGTVMSVVGQIQAGQAADEQAQQQAVSQEQQAAVYRAQAGLKRKDAINARLQAYAEADKQRRQGARDLSQVRAGYASADVNVNKGSARDAQLELQTRILQDVKSSELTGRKAEEHLNAEAAQYDVRAGDLVSAAGNTREAGGAAATAGYLGALGTGIQGAGKAWQTMTAPKTSVT